MSKIMTLYMLFEAIKDGRVTLETEFRVSDRAHAMGGSTMFLDQLDRPKVDDLIKGIIVQSGNDACVVVAEGLAGSEEAFARLMTERGVAMGLQHSTFTNSTGWPDPGHRMSMEDLGKVATAIITEYPEFYSYFALTEWDFDGRAPQNRFNRNPILGLGIGADGLKTGHTQEAGYGLVGSAIQNGRRIVFVVTGLDSMAARGEEVREDRQLGLPPVRGARPGEGRHGAGRGAGVDGRQQQRGAGGAGGREPSRRRDPARSCRRACGIPGPIEAPIAAGAQVGELVSRGTTCPRRAFRSSRTAKWPAAGSSRACAPRRRR